MHAFHSKLPVPLDRINEPAKRAARATHLSHARAARAAVRALDNIIRSPRTPIGPLTPPIGPHISLLDTLRRQHATSLRTIDALPAHVHALPCIRPWHMTTLKIARKLSNRNWGLTTKPMEAKNHATNMSWHRAEHATKCWVYSDPLLIRL